jgi:hypothetical protein
VSKDALQTGINYANFQFKFANTLKLQGLEIIFIVRVLLARGLYQVITVEVVSAIKFLRGQGSLKNGATSPVSR